MNLPTLVLVENRLLWRGGEILSRCCTQLSIIYHQIEIENINLTSLGALRDYLI